MPSHPVNDASAVWLDPTTIAVPGHQPTSLREPSRSAWTLHWSPSCTMDANHLQVADHVAIDLARGPALDADQLDRHPQLRDHLVLSLPAQVARSVPEMITGQLFLERHRDGQRQLLTGVQLAPLLDHLYADSARTAELGAVVGPDSVEVSIWAPTAQRVRLLTSPAEAGSEPPLDQAGHRTMRRRPDGIWTTSLGREHIGARYLFEVVVYVPATGRLETNLVTDPYSAGLTLNSARSVVVDLADPDAMPHGWQTSHGPRLEQLVDATIYELHVRDFSMSDPEVPEQLRGSYLAFAEDGLGARHLRRLAQAGLNTVHLLPCYDITSIDEDRSTRQHPSALEAMDPAGPEQQRAIAAFRDRDAFNWGYDPWHWMVPEGAYCSTNAAADGADRVREFRTMVDALHQMGLRVVLDQVFTHTAFAGQDRQSVLDRIVPNYYYRLDAKGHRYHSTVCNNTAMEHAMAEKVMVDAVLRWARDYHVDGFRFDLMGHSSAANMLAVREALDGLTLAEDGVDGSQVYLYGEGWNFGEVADNALFRQASQGQLTDSRVATFSDRLRDAVRGGRPHDDDPRHQGFATGLGTDPNDRHRPRKVATQLAEATDLVMLGLAGNLRELKFRGSLGEQLCGSQVSYFGSPAGYADEPSDVVSYVDAHDNETLWDALVMKLPRVTSMADRIRMNTLALACATLAQTPVLWHAGVDLLRSKSLDRNSFDAGDWFNRLDWTGADNGFARGLPSADDNMTRWRWLEPLLRDPALKPSAAEVAHACDQAHELLRLRFSTRLLRLGSAELIRTKVRFPVSGTGSVPPGVLVMHVDDRLGPDVDPELDGLVVVFNASPVDIVQPIGALAAEQLELHPIQAQGCDEVVRRTSWQAAEGTLFVPARTVAVLVHRH